jgi:hypothetical protein
MSLLPFDRELRFDFRAGPALLETLISELSLSLRLRLRVRVLLGLKGRSVRHRPRLTVERLELLRGGDEATLQMSESSVRSETSSPSAASPSHSSSEVDSAGRARCLEGLLGAPRRFADILMKILGRESGWTFEAEGSKADSAPMFFRYSKM